MKTYIIQYKERNLPHVPWVNLSDHSNFPIEFVTLEGALAVATILRLHTDGFSIQADCYQIKDSTGKIYIV